MWRRYKIKRLINEIPVLICFDGVIDLICYVPFNLFNHNYVIYNYLQNCYKFFSYGGNKFEGISEGKYYSLLVISIRESV